MKHVHVCLVSDQPIPNLTTVLQFKPDTVVLLKTKEMDEKAMFLEKVVKEHHIDVTSMKIEAYDISNVIDISNSIINYFKGSDLSLNITGGTKIGTLGTFQAFYTAGKPIYYVNTKDNKILQLFPESEGGEIEIKISISISDYLAAYGFLVDSYVKDDSYIYRRKELTNYLAGTIDTNPKIIPAINGALHIYNKETNFPISINLPKDDKLIKMIELLDGVRRKGNGDIEISTLDSLMYLKGFWFEEYVYMIVKSLKPDEVRLNVKGKWVTKSQDSPKNEFDIMFSKKNRLFYISCKTANPDRKIDESGEVISKEFIYELDSLGDKALGLFGKRMLVSARQINNLMIKERARILNVAIVDGKNINTLKENLRQWLNQ